jgi:radical SAM superfamily enzyme YgiQ (UPF0313 family)
VDDYDMVFMHPPSSFHKLAHPLGGIFEAGTGTTDMLTMMPLGVVSMANELHREGFRTAVLNVARLFVGYRREGRETLDEDLARHGARVYGIDLHWAAHTSGALDLARRLRRLRPDATIVFGGMTATFFAADILRDHPCVDGVVLGECDGHVGRLLSCLLDGRPGEAPGLAYRRPDGTVAMNERRDPVLDRVDYVDGEGLIHPRPSLERLEREAIILNVPVVRGCSRDCLFCGGSRRAYERYFGRPRVELLSVERVLDHARRAAEAGISGIKLFGDVRLGGRSWVRALAEGLREHAHRLDLHVELFWPAPEEHLRLLRGACRDLHLSLSPESSHVELRRMHGKRFDNDALLDQIRLCRELDVIPWVWLAYLLPGHDRDNLRAELEFIREALALDPSLTTVAHPYLFIDPASEIYDSPERFGFEVTFRTLEDIKRGMDRAYWFFSIGYRTETFDERDFHEAVLSMTLEQARIYFDSRRLGARDLLKTMDKIRSNRLLMERIAAEPGMDDARIATSIEELFPSHLRRANSSLLVWPFFGEAASGAAEPDALLHEAFPTVLEIALRRDPGSAERVHELLVSFRRSHEEELAAMQDCTALPGEIGSLMRRILAPAELAREFVEDLLAFEWTLYRFLDLGPGSVEGPRWRDDWILLRARYDLLDVVEVAEHVERGRAEPPRRDTCYLLGLRDGRVHGLDFDPTLDVPSFPDATVRRMSDLGRRLVRAERTVTRVLSRLLDRDDPHLPLSVVSRRTIGATELPALL